MDIGQYFIREFQTQKKVQGEFVCSKNNMAGWWSNKESEVK